VQCSNIEGAAAVVVVVVVVWLGWSTVESCEIAHRRQRKKSVIFLFFFICWLIYFI
jgi:hypothetical protein